MQPKKPPINELIKFGNRYTLRLGSNDFKNPTNINGYVISFGMMKCFKSIKNIIMKPILKTKNKRLVNVKPNK